MESQEIEDFSKFSLVFLANGNILTAEDGSFCLQRKQDGNLVFVQPTDKLIKAFDLKWDDPSESPQLESLPDVDEEPQPCTAREDSNKRGKWTRDSILLLIKLRIQCDDKFQSTKCKNDVVWNRVASELGDRGYHMSPTQCNDKWRYLKARYTQKKDNMGARGTGEPPVEFPYFEEMDAFLGNKRSITPTVIASSMKGDTLPNVEQHALQDEERCDDEDDQPHKKQKVTSTISTTVKRNKTRYEKILEEMKIANTTREQNRERRHKEVLETRNSAITIFSEKMDLLLAKLPEPQE